MKSLFLSLLVIILTASTVFAVPVNSELFLNSAPGNIVYAVDDLKQCPEPISGVVCRKYILEPPIGLKFYNEKIYKELVAKYKLAINAQITEAQAVLTIYEFQHPPTSFLSETVEVFSDAIAIGTAVAAPIVNSAKAGVHTIVKASLESHQGFEKDNLVSSFEIKYPDGKSIQADCDNLASDVCRANLLNGLKERAARLSK